MCFAVVVAVAVIAADIVVAVVAVVCFLDRLIFRFCFGRT